MRPHATFIDRRHPGAVGPITTWRGVATEQTALTPPAIYLTCEDALALYQAGADDWRAATALRYLAQRARARGDRQRAMRLLETARDL